MKKELANPLQALILTAGKLPAKTGETDRFHARFSSAGTGIVILADVSGSMDEPAGGRRKIDVLRAALVGVWPELPGASLLAFSDRVTRLSSPAELPAPSGATALHLALDAAAQARPAKTLVISDGQPDAAAAALASADRLPGRIDVIYCGPDSDKEAIAFMYRLARVGGGSVVVRDVARESRPQLGGAIRAALGLPAPINKE